MQHPKDEIKHVILKLLSTQSPDEQKKAMTRYFTENAEFRSPLHNVAAGRQSREDGLGVYQWLRVVSPNTEFESTNIIFNESSRTLVVEGNILFRIRFSPIPSQPARVFIIMKLEKKEKDYLIKSQEYLYQPQVPFTSSHIYLSSHKMIVAQELMMHLFPPFAPLVGFGLSTLTYASAIGAKLAQVMGVWRVSAESGSSGRESYAQAARRAPQGHENRAHSTDSRASDETRVGANENHSGSEKPGGGEPRVKVNGKSKKRKDASGYPDVATN
ncbi:hypothetical protein C0991_011580 [Blastosporella zonata]|nr:hypothetical protein C0991_011580 [Blastosporella zonata]